jgi:SAM-dependent methyltransferase
MPEWKIAFNYDYRFASVMLKAHHGDEESPQYSVRVSDLLRQIPAYELHECMNLAFQTPMAPEPDLEEARRALIMEQDLVGKVVLDVGGYDGVMASIALAQGAQRAICLDNHQYEHYGWDDKKHPGVEYIQGDFMDVGHSFYRSGDLTEYLPDIPDDIGVIIFYNVLYHLKNPWAALDHLREIIHPGGKMLLCTLFRYHPGSWIYLYEPRECNPTDDTVYFGPSLTALERLLTATGWTHTRKALALDRVLYECAPIPNWERTHEDS